MAGPTPPSSTANTCRAISRHSSERNRSSSQGRGARETDDESETRAHDQGERESRAHIDFSVGLGSRPISLRDVMVAPTAARWARRPPPRLPRLTIAEHQERREGHPSEILSIALNRALDILSDDPDLFDE